MPMRIRPGFAPASSPVPMAPPVRPPATPHTPAVPATAVGLGAGAPAASEPAGDRDTRLAAPVARAAAGEPQSAARRRVPERPPDLPLRRSALQHADSCRWTLTPTPRERASNGKD